MKLNSFWKKLYLKVDVGPAGEGPTYTSQMYFLKEMMQGCSKKINTEKDQKMYHVF